MMMARVANGFVIAFMLSMCGIVALVITLYREPFPESDQARSIITNEVARGDDLIIKNSLVRLKSCAAVIYRAAYDADGTKIYTDTEYRPGSSIKSGQRIADRREIHIPDWATPGEAVYEVDIDWSCNAVQRLFPNVQILPPLQFIIK